ncbi:hypothetical protein [Sphingobacterium multivorum]|uniref:hypothetical protein n=1 Tax=Sphingobacterium multivorum TaxID=28454 RepID=UPI003DA1CF9C
MSLLFRFLLVLSPAFIFAQGHVKEIDCVNNIKLYKSYEDYSKGKVLDSACLSKQGNELEKYWGRIVLKKEYAAPLKLDINLRYEINRLN